MSFPSNKPRIVAIIQARMGSTRLPGKTMVDVEGKPLLKHIVDRVSASKKIDAVLIATTTSPEDKVILEFARQNNIQAYAGSDEDVLERFYEAAKVVNADIIVRITADDPFKDPEVLDTVVDYYLSHPELDYASNTIVPSYPEGLDIEVFSFLALEKAYREAKLPSEREHVTPYFWKNPDLFRIANVSNKHNLSHMRWTLDYPEDLIFTRAIYSRLNNKGIFLMDDIFSLLKNEPELIHINEGIGRNAGYIDSLERDHKFLSKNGD